MGWMNKLISFHNKKEKCLICESTVGENAGVVEYRYQGGIGKAFVCEKCADEMNQNNLGDIDEAI